MVSVLESYVCFHVPISVGAVDEVLLVDEVEAVLLVLDVLAVDEVLLVDEVEAVLLVLDVLAVEEVLLVDEVEAVLLVLDVLAVEEVLLVDEVEDEDGELSSFLLHPITARLSITVRNKRFFLIGDQGFRNVKIVFCGENP